MPRPSDRAGLLAAAESEFTRLWQAMDTFDPQLLADVAWQAPIEDQSRNPRDVVMHLHGWQQMLLGWVADAEAGRAPAVPAPGYSWRRIPAINAELWQRFSRTSWPDAVVALHGSHAEVIRLIERHTDADLFTKGRFAWTGGTTFGSFAVSVTSSHYVWGRKTLRLIARSL